MCGWPGLQFSANIDNVVVGPRGRIFPWDDQTWWSDLRSAGVMLKREDSAEKNYNPTRPHFIRLTAKMMISDIDNGTQELPPLVKPAGQNTY